MGILGGASKERIQAMYHRAYVEAKGGFVDPRKYPYLDRELRLYAKENNCSYDDAVRISKQGSYDLVETDTELYITERVNNILFKKILLTE